MSRSGKESTVMEDRGGIGEVIDIVKKHGGENASQDSELKEHLVEELADVLMYYNDIHLCYGIST